MHILHILAVGHHGGIETLIRDYGKYSKLDNDFLFLCDTGSITEEMLTNGNCVVDVSPKNKLGYINSFHKALNLCLKEKYDAIIIHHQSPYTHFLHMYLKNKIHNLYSFCYAHSVSRDWYKYSNGKLANLYKKISKKSFSKCDCAIAISDIAKQSLIEEGYATENKIVRVYNGVDTEKFVPNELNKNSLTNMICVGRLVKEKGVQNILQAFVLLPIDKRPQFSIVGDGNFRPELEQFVKDNKLEKWVHFLGTRNDVNDLLNKADVFIFTPICEEGFGISVVEAMATGKVCICGNRGAIPEIIEDGVNGFIVNSDDPNDIAVCIQKVFEKDNSNYIQMRSNAVERAKDFDIHKFVSNLDEVIIEKVTEKR